jgi:hypothetical protein
MYGRAVTLRFDPRPDLLEQKQPPSGKRDDEASSTTATLSIFVYSTDGEKLFPLFP